MSLKSCVVCIAGDIRQDTFAPDSWEDANIERWFKQRNMKLIWEDMNKSVTHLVISRAAFKSKHAARQYVDMDRRGEKRAKIVTVDWLEDSWDVGKAIQDVSVYNPGKPRDIEGIVVVYSKLSKTAKCKSADKVAAPEREGPSQATEIRQENQVQTKTSTSSTLNPASKKDSGALAVDKYSRSVITQSSATSKQPASETTNLFEKKTISASDTNTQAPKDSMNKKPQVQATPIGISGVGIELSWEDINRPRVFCDKTDQFEYSIKLTHTERPGDKWVLLLLKAPDVVDKAFLFRAYQYNAKNAIHLREDNSQRSSFQKAFELFKISFSSKMGYPWNERLIRTDQDQLGKWRYRLPVKGEPTGEVPPEFDPSHPRYVKPKDLAATSKEYPAQNVIETNAFKHLSTCAKAQRGKVKQCYQSKARKSVTPTSMKRRAEKELFPKYRPKITKIGSNKFKSTEFVEGSDLD